MPQVVQAVRRRLTIPPSDSPMRDREGRGTASRYDWSQSAILGSRSATARDFADLVAARMVGSALPWTQRRYLLSQATKRDIGRFEANLIIAAVQNHFSQNPPLADDPIFAPKRRWRIPVGWLTFCVVQAAIVTFAWRILFS